MMLFENDTNNVSDDVASAVVDSTVSTLPERTFSMRRNLVEIGLPLGLQSIGQETFLGCSALKNIDVPSTVTVIGAGTFQDCASLATATFATKGLILIPPRLFQNCYNLRKFLVPQTVSAIEDEAFQHCLQLVSIELHGGELTTIGSRCFEGCESLRNICLCPQVCSNSLLVAEDAFDSCESLLELSSEPRDTSTLLRSRFDGSHLHQLCYAQSFMAPDRILELLGKAGRNLSTKDPFAMTPLHVLALSTKPNMALCHALLQDYPEDLLVENIWGDQPLHEACACNAPLNMIRRLVDTLVEKFPDQPPDWVSLIHRTDSAEIIQYLVLTSLATRINYLGSERWRCSIMRAIEELGAPPKVNSMIHYNRKGLIGKTRIIQQIGLIHHHLDQLLRLEVLSLLELTVWKAKMKCSPKLDKSTCRVRCGVEVVIKNVLPFMDFADSTAYCPMGYAYHTLSLARDYIPSVNGRCSAGSRNQVAAICNDNRRLQPFTILSSPYRTDCTMRIGSKNRKISNTYRKETRRKCGFFTVLALVAGSSFLFLIQLNRSVIYSLKQEDAAASIERHSLESSTNDQRNRKNADNEVRIRRNKNDQSQPTQNWSPQQKEENKVNQQKEKSKVKAAEIVDTRYHLVFSTSCTKNDWQSYLFFYLAMAHNQTGDVTHLVSGCKDQETEDELRRLHNDYHTQAMSRNFLIHFTPDFSDRRQFQVTKYWNKPFGVNHWLQNRFGFRFDTEKGDVVEPTDYDDDIIILIDPDMLMLKPFHNDFSANPKTLWATFFQEHEDNLFYKVKQGQVLSQEYAFGGTWLRGLKEEGKSLTHVLGTSDSPVHSLTVDRAAKLYAGGPPYIATARDFFKISHYWTDFLPRFFQEKPGMMNEMYSYSMAVAHLGLKHQLAKGFMVSDTAILNAEGWDFLTTSFGSTEDSLQNACNMSRYSTSSLPQVLHFCQRYGIGEFFISKYKVPRRTFTCSFPLYEEPPVNVAEALYTHMGNFENQTWDPNNRKHTARRVANAFMVCSLYSALNEAGTFYKDHHCNPDSANYEKSWQYFKVYDRDPHGPGGGGGSRSKPKRP
eukprot:scaffold8259_cov143-Cylindrotheca_fusiformis.AAC.13